VVGKEGENGQSRNFKTIDFSVDLMDNKFGSKYKKDSVDIG